MKKPNSEIVAAKRAAQKAAAFAAAKNALVPTSSGHKAERNLAALKAAREIAVVQTAVARLTDNQVRLAAQRLACLKELGWADKARH